MSGETIPEDVMKTVAKAVLELDDTVWKNGEECGVSHGLAGRVLVRLILAERERCAVVAEALPLTELHRWGVDADGNPKLAWRLGAETQQTAIAYSIRSSS